MSRSLLIDGFARVARERRGRPAIHALAEGRTFTFEEILGDAAAFGAAIRRAGLQQTSILSLIGNRAAFVPAFLAMLEHDAVLMPLDAGSSAAEALHLAGQFGIAAAIAPAEPGLPGFTSIAALPRRLALFRFVGEADRVVVPDAVLFKITSGSAGRPKAVACSEAALAVDGHHIIEAMGIGADDVNFAAIPLSHSYGLGNLLMPLLLQGSAIALRNSFVPDRFVEDIVRSGATVFPGVPFMFDYMVRDLAAVGMPGSMRLMLTAGASMPLETVMEFRRIFGVKIHSFYGASETGGIAYDDSDAIHDPLPVGRPMPGTTVTLRAIEEGVGRVHVCGGAVAAGYAGEVEAKDQASFCDGGFLTGDMGRFSDGQLVLTGRVTGFVNVVGRKVHPDEVERVLRDMPQVADARVLGVPCNKRGEMLVACLVLEGDQALSASAIRRHCSTRLSPFKIPRHYVFLDALPVDARGKTDRHALEALVERSINGAKR